MCGNEMSISRQLALSEDRSVVCMKIKDLWLSGKNSLAADTIRMLGRWQKQ